MKACWKIYEHQIIERISGVSHSEWAASQYMQVESNNQTMLIITEMLTETYLDAAEIASAETELPESTFPETCPYTVEHLMGE